MGLLLENEADCLIRQHTEPRHGPITGRRRQSVDPFRTVGGSLRKAALLPMRDNLGGALEPDARAVVGKQQSVGRQAAPLGARVRPSITRVPHALARALRPARRRCQRIAFGLEPRSFGQGPIERRLLPLAECLLLAQQLGRGGAHGDRQGAPIMSVRFGVGAHPLAEERRGEA
jgi:hypothetical protein